MRREWTEEEEKYMLKYYSLQSIEKTASWLGRSVNSVKGKARRLGLNLYMDNLGARTVARCFNSDTSVVLRWIRKYGLPAKRILVSNQTRYNIDIDKFWEWAELHKDIIPWSKYQEYSLPPEPDWVKFERNNYKIPNHRKPITSQDIQNIKRLFMKTDLNYTGIAKEVGRTTESIRHIMRSKNIA